MKVKAIYHTGHVTKFLLIFRNNLRLHEKRYRFEMALKRVRIVKKISNSKNFFKTVFFFVILQILDNTNVP